MEWMKTCEDVCFRAGLVRPRENAIARPLKPLDTRTIGLGAWCGIHPHMPESDTPREKTTSAVLIEHPQATPRQGTVRPTPSSGASVVYERVNLR